MSYSTIYIDTEDLDNRYTIWIRCIRICSVVQSTCHAYIQLSIQKFLVPHLQPPNSTMYDEDCEALAAQFDAARAVPVLEDIFVET
jgi:hypothetical protein